MDLCRLCAKVEPEIPPPITRQSYCASSEEAWRDDDVVVVAVGVDIMDVGGANASVFDTHKQPISSVEDFTIFINLMMMSCCIYQFELASSIYRLRAKQCSRVVFSMKCCRSVPF